MLALNCTAFIRQLIFARLLVWGPDEAMSTPVGLIPGRSKALGAYVRTVERTRQKCVEMGIDAALNHARHQKKRKKVLDGEAEARLVQLACSEAPDGREQWSLQLLADKLIELEVVETVSKETVRTTLKKMNLSLG